MLDMIIWFHHTSNATDVDVDAALALAVLLPRYLNPSQLLSFKINNENGIVLYHNKLLL